MDLNLEKPLAPFIEALQVPNAQLVPQVSANLTAVSASEMSTRFEIGWRYTGVVISLVVWVAYTVMLFCGPGVRDTETGKRVAATFEQRFVWVLSFLCIFLDRPGFATEVIAPTLAAYAFGAVSQITAVAALLLFFLVNFHVLALQTEAGASGVQWDIEAYEGGVGPDGKRRRPIVGPCFYIPKVLIITLAWAVALSMLLYSRYMQLTDPAFSVAESYPDFWVYLRNFTYVIGGVYIALLLFYIALGLRKCRSMPRSGVFFTTITLLTLVLTVAGVFANSFTNTLSFSGFYIVAYGVANVYIWMLCLFFSPAQRVTMAQLARNAAALASGKELPDAEAGNNTPSSGVFEGGMPEEAAGPDGVEAGAAQSRDRPSARAGREHASRAPATADVEAPEAPDFAIGDQDDAPGTVQETTAKGAGANPF